MRFIFALTIWLSFYSFSSFGVNSLHFGNESKLSSCSMGPANNFIFSDELIFEEAEEEAEDIIFIGKNAHSNYFDISFTAQCKDFFSYKQNYKSSFILIYIARLTNGPPAKS